MSRLEKTEGFQHQSSILSRCVIELGGEMYLAQVAVRPSTPTIVNTAITTGNWTAVATGLTGVLSWKLNERDGERFDYAYVAAPATYMTSDGPLERDLEITAIYVRKPEGVGVNLNMQLETWGI